MKTTLSTKIGLPNNYHIGQQISVSAAISIRRRFIQAMGIQHPSGLWCYPTPNK
ncbi:MULTISPECIES: hypothetical protein [Photorhabdus]|uniref:hypothetical protein n=1 Tax=Photorhabdus TaxID=29487 RepID=UPI0003147BAA|nr:hypothetical protein [Photorhabdus asymbiotica]